MEIILIIYFGINLFMTWYFLNENLKWETKTYAILFAIVCLLFGTVVVIFVPLFYSFSPIFEWISHEIKFWYRIKCTNYQDNIFLDDNYSDEYISREEKLKRMENLAKNFNKQSKRHSKIVCSKYR